MIRLRFFIVLVVAFGLVGIVFAIKTPRQAPTNAPLTPRVVQAVSTSSPSPVATPIDMEDDSHVSSADASVSVTTKQIIDDKYLGEFSPNSNQKNRIDFGSNEAGLEDALQGKYGNKISFLLTHSDGHYAQGLLDTGSSQDKWWIAAKKSSKWILIADGYSYVTCEDIAPYAFPSSIVPMCWSNQKNTLIQR
ncbi:MAG: hypothetical protein ABI758_05655 [Candidatus Woesebacteria bacterium]